AVARMDHGACDGSGDIRDCLAMSKGGPADTIGGTAQKRGDYAQTQPLLRRTVHALAAGMRGRVRGAGPPFGLGSLRASSLAFSRDGKWLAIGGCSRRACSKRRTSATSARYVCST